MEVRDLGLEVQGVGVKSRAPWKREGVCEDGKMSRWAPPWAQRMYYVDTWTPKTRDASPCA